VPIGKSASLYFFCQDYLFLYHRSWDLVFLFIYRQESSLEIKSHILLSQEKEQGAMQKPC
jgi:hypothetical protein